MHLSSRLRTIADMIPQNSIVVDVGCDHALLDIYLTKNKKNKCIACDVRASVLEIAKKNITDAGLEKEISIIQSNGLEKVEVPKNAIAVIAGMGSFTILSILKNPKANLFSYLIIQTNNDWEFFRKSMSQMGFQLVEEQTVCDKNKYYVFMKWMKGKCKYSKKECFLGPLLMQQKDTIPYYRKLLEQYQNIDANIPWKHIYKKYHIRHRIHWIQKELKK